MFSLLLCRRNCIIDPVMGTETSRPRRRETYPAVCWDQKAFCHAGKKERRRASGQSEALVSLLSLHSMGTEEILADNP